MQGSEIDDQMQRAYTIALAKSQAYGTAFDRLLQNKNGGNNNDRNNSTSNEVIKELVARSSNIDFIFNFFKYQSVFSNKLSSEVALSLVERLLHLGFPIEASKYIDLIDQNTDSERLKLVKAEISIRSGNPRYALELISDLPGEEPDELRAIAYEELGDHTSAAAIFSNSGRSIDAKRNLWLAEGWTKMEKEFPDEFKILKRVLNDDLPRLNQTNEFLSDLDALIETVRSTHDNLQNVLSDSTNIE
jgi:hypothetical protein